MYRNVILAAFMGLMSASASAITLNFTCITNSNAGDCAIGEANLSADLEETGPEQVAFIFRNTGNNASSITEIYFDDGTLLGIANIIDADEGLGGHSGVDFTAGSASPPNLPGGNNVSPAFEVTAGFLADADSPPPKKGINPGEWLTIIFDLQSNQTVNDVASQLGNGALRIGMHVTGYESGGSESFVNIETPAPAAIWLFLSALPMFFARRYRKKK